MSHQPVIIELKKVLVSLGGRDILNGINLQIRQGDFFYLVGRSGSGKSTLLRLLYADQKPQSGSIRVDNYDVTRLDKKQVPHLRRRLGIVFQDYQLLPDRTVSQNIQFAMQASGNRRRSQIKQRTNELLFQVGMTGKSKAMPHQLSGGEQQRVAIARALINHPAVVIADEPTGNLDPHAAADIMDIIQKINYSGTSVIMATHEYSLIHDYPGKVIELSEGNAEIYHDSQEFLASYRQRLR